MKILFARMRKRIDMTYKNFKSDISFSSFYALLRILDEIGGRLHLKKISGYAHEKKDLWILKYLKNEIKDIILRYSNCEEKGKYEANAPIWVCWWTGEDSAPELVKQCIRSIRKHAGNHPVNFIDEKTYSMYVTIPDYILRKVKSGNIGIAHLSDYIRVSLLEKYGGLWLDATIFCSSKISEEYFEMPLFTCKSELQKCRYISQMQWTTFVLGGWKGNVFYRYLKDAFEEYWKKVDVAIDYLFFDYLIEVARQKLPFIKKCMDNIPVNNIHRDDLQAAMNQAISGNQFYNIITPETVLYKLSWRETYKARTEDGDESIYTSFLNHHI